ncbi:MAG: hypothetical protein U0361_02810 [Nitrospiraceae bacterium]
MVRSAITTYADQRIETIKQQVMSRATLWKIVEQYDLHRGMRKRSPTEDVLQRFVKDIKIDDQCQGGRQAHADATSRPRSRSRCPMTVRPEISQKVANELTSLFRPRI